jgi:hypothetical protein
MIKGLGVGDLMGMISNPNKVAGLMVEKMPAATHILARHRLAQELTTRAAIFTAACHSTLAKCLLEKREPSPEELNALKTQEFDLLQVAVGLHKFPGDPSQMTMDWLKLAYGVPPEASNG